LISTIRVVDPEIILLDLALSLRDPLDAVHLVQRSAPGIPLVVLADAAALTRELQTFAQPVASDLNEVASGLVSLLDKVIGKNIEVKFVSGPVDRVRADSTQIEQMLMNLCLNARDAMPQGGQIEAEMVELDKPYWVSTLK
jgi:signal transduction histidine kinase